MTETVQPVAIEPPKMTPEQAEAYGLLMHHAAPLIDKYFAHVERSNEQARQAARPIFIVAGVIAASVSVVAIYAVVSGSESQLARELLLPLLSFAGGLGIGRATTPTK